MAVIGMDAYTWYSYKATATYYLANAKNQEATLSKGKIFGIRKAGSKKEIYRLIVRDLGPGVLFSLPATALTALLKKSDPLKGGLPKPDAKTKKLVAKLRLTDPKDFWSVVDAVNWPKYYQDAGYATTARLALLECYGLSRVKTLWKTAVRFRNQLQKAVFRFEERSGAQLFLGGDDSLYDAVAHAVSMGQKKFEAFLENPDSFIKNFNRLTLESENFESCFDVGL